MLTLVILLAAPDRREDRRDRPAKVEAVSFPKVDFDTWFEKVRAET